MTADTCCQWCGQPLTQDQVMARVSPNPAAGGDTVVTACTQQHLQQLRPAPAATDEEPAD